jgi:hypothetical protein
MEQTTAAQQPTVSLTKATPTTYRAGSGMALPPLELGGYVLRGYTMRPLMRA